MASSPALGARWRGSQGGARDLRDLRPWKRARGSVRRSSRRARSCRCTSRRTSRRWCTRRSATQRPAVASPTLACTASIGPGSTNMLTGAATATTNRLPVLLLPSDTFANRRQGPVLQQLEHPTDADVTVNDAFRPLSRFFDRIARPEQLLTALPQAMRVLLDPAETGAVTIALHQDVQGEAFDWPLALLRAPDLARRAPAPRDRPRGSRRVRAAHGRAPAADRGGRRALLGSGGGAAALRRAARHSRRRDVGRQGRARRRSTGSPAASGSTGPAAANELAREADVVLCVGTRLSDFTTGSHSLFQHPDVRFVGINVNAADAHKLSASPVVADAREALDALRDALDGWSTRAGIRATSADARRALALRPGADLAPRPATPDGPRGRCCGRSTRPCGDGDWVVAAAGWQPGRPAQALGNAGRQLHAHRVRVLVHGPRDSRGARHPMHEGRGAGGARRHRRRHVPDEPDRAGDRGPGGPQADRRRARQRRIPVDQPVGARQYRHGGRQRVPPARRRRTRARRRAASPSTTWPTPAAWAARPCRPSTLEELSGALARASGGDRHHRDRLPDRADDAAAEQRRLLGPRRSRGRDAAPRRSASPPSTASAAPQQRY